MVLLWVKVPVHWLWKAWIQLWKEAQPSLQKLSGGGMAADAYHLTGTHPEGEGAYLGMMDALEDAGIDAVQN